MKAFYSACKHGKVNHTIVAVSRLNSGMKCYVLKTKPHLRHIMTILIRPSWTCKASRFGAIVSSATSTHNIFTTVWHSIVCRSKCETDTDTDLRNIHIQIGLRIRNSYENIGMHMETYTSQDSNQDMLMSG